MTSAARQMQRAAFRRQRLPERDDGHARGTKIEHRRDEAGQNILMQFPMNIRQKAAENGADDEAERHPRTDPPEALGAAFHRGEIDHHCVRDGHIAGHQSAQQPGGEKHRDGGRGREQEIGERAAEQADDQDGAAAEPVAQPSRDRSAEELHRGEA